MYDINIFKNIGIKVIKKGIKANVLKYFSEGIKTV